MPYTVLLLAADPLVRAALSAFLSDHDVGVFAEFAASDDFTEFLADVDAVIWEVDELDSLPPGALSADVPLLALVPDAEVAARALRHGAAGILERAASGERLLAALGALARGLAVLEPAFLAVSTAHEDTNEDASALEPLTPRERDVLELLAEGMSNKAIAKRLEISDHTVKFHLAAVLSKLGATSRTEAVTKAVRAGMLTL